MKLKIYYLAIVLSLFTGTDLLGQDIPLFSQKLTNSFIYNPALTGHSFGSVTYAHRGAFNNVEGSDQSNFLSFQTPIREKNFGVGANFFNEKISFMNNTFASIAFAYHLDLGQGQLLSAGVAGEYNLLRPDYDRVVGDASDQILATLDNGDYDKVDFSTGILYSHPYFNVGLSANRLASAINNDSRTNVLSQYYTLQTWGKIPLRSGNDLLEPMFVYRKYSSISSTFDLGFYYTYNDLIIVGGSARMGIVNGFPSVENKGIDIFNLTAGLKVLEQILIGFSYDITNSNIARLGNSSEITFRYDFAVYDEKYGFNRKYGRPSNYKGDRKMRKVKKRKPRKKY